MVSPSSCQWALPCRTASSLGCTYNSGACCKGPSAGPVALVLWGNKNFLGKYFCGPSGHHSTGLPSSLAKLPLKPGWWQGMYAHSSRPNYRGQCISKAHLRPQRFQQKSQLVKPNEAGAMDESRSFLSRSSCACPEVSVRNLSRCPQKAPHLDTPSGNLRFCLVVRNPWRTHQHQCCCQEICKQDHVALQRL